MNKTRRAEIEKAIAMLEEAKGILETAASDEREYYDNMPESFQQGENGSAAEAAADALEAAAEAIDEAISQAQEAVQ